jgi:hypothetical protein
LANKEALRNFRVADIKRIITHRFHGRLPNSKTGRAMLRAAFDHLSQLEGGGWRCAQFGAQFAPEITDQAGMIERAIAEQVFHTSYDLGQLFGLSCAERSTLKITTIACIDLSQEQQAAIARDRRNTKAREKRAAENLKNGAGQPRGRVSDRADAILHVLSQTGRWMTTREVAAAVEWLRQFRDARGRPLRSDSLSKAVRLASEELERRALIESRMVPTKFKAETREIRRALFGPSRSNFRAEPGNEKRVATKEPGNFP